MFVCLPVGVGLLVDFGLFYFFGLLTCLRVCGYVFVMSFGGWFLILGLDFVDWVCCGLGVFGLLGIGFLFCLGCVYLRLIWVVCGRFGLGSVLMSWAWLVLGFAFRGCLV